MYPQRRNEVFNIEFDGVIQAMSGLMHLTGEPDGPPMLAGIFVPDHLAGLYASLATSFALQRRQITGELDRVVEAGQLDGSFDVADVRLTTNSLLSLGIDISRWYQDSSRISPQQIADHHVHLALRMVGARPRALVPGRRPRGSPRGQAT